MTAAPSTEGLRPQDLVLTIVGAHLRRPGEMVWSGGMVEILQSLDFTNGAARAALARLVNRDLLARQRDGRRALYALTARATDLLAEGDRRIFSFGRTEPAAETWTVLWHAIPDDRRTERTRLSSRLRFLGFGAVQDATWVAARDREPEVRELLRVLAIEPFSSVMVGRISSGLEPVTIITQAWNLELAQRRYEAFLRDFEPLRRAQERRRLTGGQAFRRRILLLHRFREFPFLDPELPGEHDPLRALRTRALDCFDDLYARLRDPATEYFWSVAGPDLAAVAAAARTNVTTGPLGGP